MGIFSTAKADNNSVIVRPGGNPAAEFLAILGFKVLTGSDKDVRCRIELQKLSGPLLCQVVGHHKEMILTQASRLLSMAAATISKVLPAPTT